MKPSEYGAVFAAEDSHWWYTGMRAITECLLQRFYPKPGNLRILDAGCGTGGSMVYLAGYGEVLGCDYSSGALAYCRRRQLPSLSRASVEGLPYAENSFDLVTSFDVLYHQAVVDYHGALAQFYRVLKPGGRLFLRLPAYNWLRGHHDTVIATARRFTTGEVRDALLDVHFVVEQLSYANCLLFPLALAKRILERFVTMDADTSDVYPVARWQNQLFSSVLKAEAKWLGHGNTLPFGLTVVAIGKKV
jgi:SAM-dependent methyltransferase